MNLNYNYNFFNKNEITGNFNKQSPIKNPLGINSVVPKFTPQKTIYCGTQHENLSIKS